jgi:CheY-like chemotaxis protein
LIRQSDSLKPSLTKIGPLAGGPIFLWDFWLCGEAADGQAAVQNVGELFPDVLLLDLSFFDENQAPAFSTWQKESQQREKDIYPMSVHGHSRNLRGAGAT